MSVLPRLTPMTSQRITQAVEQLSTVNDFIRWAVSWLNESQCFYGHGTDNSWDEAVSLVLQTVHLPWDIDTRTLTGILTRDERFKVAFAIAQRAVARRPVAYITGTAWFLDWAFYVDERVLIPRSPIAQCIEQDIPLWFADKPLTRVLDLCTGSGCIGIALALRYPQLSVDLLDVDEKALEVAAINVASHQVQDQVRLMCSDVFAALDVGQTYDLIMANPPYVPESSMADLPREYHHEPRHALQSGAQGLDVIHQILTQAAHYLTDGGLLVVEVGEAASYLVESYPQLPFTWLEHLDADEGVFVLSRSELLAIDK